MKLGLATDGWDVSGAQDLGISGTRLDRGGRGLPPDATARPDRVIRSIAELVPAA